MVKKLLSILFCVALIFSLVVSASAAGNGGSDSVYSVIPFDQVGPSVSVDTFDPFAGDEGTGSFNVTGPAGYQQVNFVGGFVYSSVRMAAVYRSARFYARDIFVPINKLTSLTFRGDFDAEYTTTVSVSASVVTMVSSGGRWVPKTDQFNFSSTDAGEVDITQEFIGAVKDITLNPVVLFSSLIIDVSTGVTDPTEQPVYSVSMDTVSSASSFSSWILFYNLTSSDGSGSAVPSLVDWLVDAVGAFLEFELFPGMSLNGIIQFVVVIGFVFWFITLLI